MTFGLSPEGIKLIVDVFKQHPEISHVQIFGSRAMNNYQNNSDIDLVIQDKISDDLQATITQQLEDLPLPYKFDVICYSDITHIGLQEHIKLFAKDIYLVNKK